MTGWYQEEDVNWLNNRLTHPQEREKPMDRINLNLIANAVTAVCAVFITFKVY